MRLRTIFGTLAVLAGAALIATAVAQPAQAGDVSRCATIPHGDTTGFTLYGGGTATLAGDGVLMATGASNNDAVTWKTTFSPAVDADTVTEASYTTTKLDVAGPGVNDAALTSYRIYVKIAGQDGVLIYEPYWNTVGNPPRNVETSWNVLTGKLWTSSSTIPGLAPTAGGPPAKTFAQVRADNPDMLVTGIGLGLGTYNTGTKSLTNDVHFKAGKTCVTHEWSTRFTPKPKPSHSSKSPSPKPTVSTSPVASASSSSSTPAATPSATGQLAVTPADYDQGQLTGTLAAGALLIVGGFGALLWGGRRRTTA